MQHLINYNVYHRDPAMAREMEYDLDILPASRWCVASTMPESRASLVYAQEMGEFWAGPGFFTRRRQLESYLLCLSLYGCGRLTYDTGVYSLPAGSFFWIDCRRPHTYETLPGAESWHTLWINFNGSTAAEYYRRYLAAGTGSPVASLPLRSEAEQTIRQLTDLYMDARGTELTDIHASALLTVLMAGCVQAAAVTAAAGQPAPPPFVKDIYEFLSENYTESITLDRLAARFNVNKYYLQKAFTRYAGCSPAEYCTRRRLTRARELLSQTGCSVGGIADMLGYDSAGYFIRLFKKREGMTPLQYRMVWAGK